MGQFARVINAHFNMEASAAKAADATVTGFSEEASYIPNAEAIAKKIFVYALAIELLLVFLDITVNYSGWIMIGPLRRLCNIAREDSLAAWLASAQTLITGLVLGGIWLQSRLHNKANWQIKGWGIVSLFFIYLAVDDGAGVHERMGSTFDVLNKMSGGSESIFPTYSWHLVMGPFFAGMGLYILQFLWRALPDRTDKLIIFCAFSCYGLAVGLDFIEGLQLTDSHTLTHYGKVTEEFLELLGTTFFLVCFVKKLLSGWSEIVFAAKR